jgi:hypothetical protein
MGAGVGSLVVVVIIVLRPDRHPLLSPTTAAVAIPPHCRALSLRRCALSSALVVTALLCVVVVRVCLRVVVVVGARCAPYVAAASLCAAL